MDPERDVGCLVLGREREQLRRDQGAVVVVERAVEHEHALVEQLAPRLGAELGDLAFFCHAPSVRDRRARARAGSAQSGAAVGGSARVPRPAVRDGELLTRVTLCPGPARSADERSIAGHRPRRATGAPHAARTGIRAVDASRAACSPSRSPSGCRSRVRGAADARRRSPAAVPSRTGSRRTAPSRFPREHADRVTCSVLVVPERRTAGERSGEDDPAAGRRHRQPQSAIPAQDPLVFPTAGGPGGGSLSSLWYFLDYADWAADDRDIILIEQRGDALAEPSLDCPELDIEHFIVDGVLLGGADADERYDEQLAGVPRLA